MGKGEKLQARQQEEEPNNLPPQTHQEAPWGPRTTLSAASGCFKIPRATQQNLVYVRPSANLYLKVLALTVSTLLLNYISLDSRTIRGKGLKMLCREGVNLDPLVAIPGNRAKLEERRGKRSPRATAVAVL